MRLWSRPRQVLNNLCANQVDVASGTVVYTGMLNRRGGFEADVTVTRVSEDQYFVVSQGAGPRRAHVPTPTCAPRAGKKL